MTTDQPVTLSVENNHGRCLLCGDRNPFSLRLSFRPDGEGTVETRFTGHGGLQGYDGMMHGGVIAALLDAAMTHCLFHQGVQAVTGDLHVRYLHAIPCEAALEIRSWVTAAQPPLYRLKSQVMHDGRVMAWAEAKFVRRRKRPGQPDQAG